VEIIVTGKVDRKYGNTQIMVADFEVADKQENISGGVIVPVYPATEGLPSRVLRSIVKGALDQYLDGLEEFLPSEIIEKYGLSPVSRAIYNIHFPEEMEDVKQARRRLVFEELFLLQTGIGMLRGASDRAPGIRHREDDHLTTEFVQSLPFELTGAQQRVLSEIRRDMESSAAMNRLIQGDVGSGKTVLAAAALVKTVASGYQGVMMAPTEILAVQHFDGLSELLAPLGIKVALLTGSMSKRRREETVAGIREGITDVVVGTHALIQDEPQFQKLGLAVTDEQHRFGVKQRAKLREKGYNPDILVMTATPIPRTLALTVYGDLDI